MVLWLLEVLVKLGYSDMENAVDRDVVGAGGVCLVEVSWISDVVTLDVLLLLVIDWCPAAWFGDAASGGGVEMCRWR